MHRSILSMLFASATLFFSMPLAAMDAATTESCFYDEAKGTFGPPSATVRGRRALAGTLANSRHLRTAPTITIDGLRYEKVGESMEASATMNSSAAFSGMVMDVRAFKPRDDEYSEYVFLPKDPRDCSWLSFRYMPEVHFAWIEEKLALMSEFLFKHSALVVDPASFQKRGETMRGIGFDIFSHPHKQADGTQPRYNRTYIEAHCAEKRLRVLDQRSYGANRELTSIAGGTDKWFTTEDVYPALAMLVHAMCEVPSTAWGEETKLPATLDEFSDYVHAAAHGKVE